MRGRLGGICEAQGRPCLAVRRGSVCSGSRRVTASNTLSSRGNVQVEFSARWMSKICLSVCRPCPIKMKSSVDWLAQKKPEIRERVSAWMVIG